MIFELAYAYVLGLLSIFSPCTFVIVPIMASEVNSRVRKMIGFLGGITFTFAALGILSALTGKLLTNFLGPYLYLGAGSITAIAGLNMLGVIDLHLPGISGLKTKNNFLMGALYGGVALSCVGPLLAAVLTFVVVKASLFIGFLMMLVFSLGFITPFILFAFLITDKNICARLIKYTVPIKKIGGVLLIGVSAYLLFIAMRGML